MEKTRKQNSGDACAANSNSWLRRTRFARSVCYKVDPSALKGYAFPFMAEEHVRNRNQSKEALNRPQGDFLHDDFPSQERREARFCSFNIESTSLATVAKPLCTDMRHESTSGKRMSVRWFFRSKSLPTRQKRVDHHDNEGNFSTDRSFSREKNDGASACDCSWSNYLATSEDEYAFEEAEDWMVDLSDLYLGCRFASGAYSRLYIGKYKDDTVAVKVLKQPEGNIDVSVKLHRQFRREVIVLSRVHHPNIVKFIGACRKRPASFIITEYLALGSLRNYLHNHPPRSLPMKLVLDMALDIAHGMEYLHSEGIFHRDLKSQNLVVAEDLHVKIADFGVACFESDTQNMEDVGTYRWMAPEMVSHKPCSRKADVFSFGMVLWELLTGKTPFEELSPIQAAFAVVNKHARPPLPLTCPSSLAHLIHRCWATDPNRRPSFSKIVLSLEEIKESLWSPSHTSRRQTCHAHSVVDFLKCGSRFREGL